MTIIDDIYDAVDDYGLISTAEAAEIGLQKTELNQQARRGKLVRVARGVYRVPVWPYQESSPYAIAVKAVGDGARLYGESVIALLNLAPTNPNRMWVASPKRVRKNLGKGTHIVKVSDEEPTVRYEGMDCQPIRIALACAVDSLGKERVLEAAEEAVRQGYLNEQEHQALKAGLCSKEAGSSASVFSLIGNSRPGLLL